VTQDGGHLNIIQQHDDYNKYRSSVALYSSKS